MKKHNSHCKLGEDMDSNATDTKDFIGILSKKEQRSIIIY
jgi:hypothetical protein